jgi:hypothetical protein
MGRLLLLNYSRARDGKMTSRETGWDLGPKMKINVDARG